MKKTVLVSGGAGYIGSHVAVELINAGYDVVVAKEATDSFTEEDYLNGLAYLKQCYGADAYSNVELKEML